ncbi:hypothetical protein NDN08_006067 [Rhodosorus marinus]|uniref:C2H2-type domain-containing protein n=1 Tax=Rhodosorus marinus TaxID=101924 RepID=A0AAV8UN85_9RHOD|nr:hypothetical protein NDN08_006067 [Rhodosorus marinus]
MQRVTDAIPVESAEWLLFWVDPLQTLSARSFDRELAVNKSLCVGSAPDPLQVVNEDFLKVLHFIDYEREDYALGRLYGAPDIGQGSFGKVVSGRFCIDCSGLMPVSHVVVQHESGIWAYMKISADDEGTIVTNAMAFHPDSKSETLLELRTCEVRDCDYCVTRNCDCECMNLVKTRVRSWVSIFKNLKLREYSCWDLFRSMCEVASVGRFSTETRVSVSGPGGDTPLPPVYMKTSVSFLGAGAEIAMLRQDYLNEVGMNRVFDNFALFMEMDEMSFLRGNLGEGNIVDVPLQEPSRGGSNGRLISSVSTSEDEETTTFRQNVSARLLTESSGSQIDSQSPDLGNRSQGRKRNSPYIKPESTSRSAFECSLCRRSFPSRYKIDRHVRAVHLRERSFKCDLCSSQYYQKSDLRKHYRLRHGKDGSVPTPTEIDV